MVEIVLLLAAGGIGLIVLLTILSVGWEVLRERKGRDDLITSLATGAQPASLHPRIDPGLCMGSGACVRACPEADVLQVLDGQAAVVNPTSCIGHGACLEACPVDAITLVLGTETRGVDIPMVDRDFQTNVPGLFVVGELGGMGLIYNATTQALQCMEALIPGLGPPAPGVHQVVIIGAGPAGIAASLSALAAGLDSVTLDQDSLGGTVLQYPRHKLVMTKPVTLPLYGRMKAREMRKEALLELWRDVVAKTGLEIRSQSRVEGVALRGDGVFEVSVAGAEPLRAQRVVLAMGRRGTPRKLGVPGEDLDKVVYRLLEPERYDGSRCLVVGGGDSALEAAVALSETGARVTLSYRKGDFSRAKKKNRERIRAKIDAGIVQFLANSAVRAVSRDSVTIVVGGSEKEVPNDYVLIFAGGLLPTKFLSAAGVEIARFTGQAYAPANPGMEAEAPEPEEQTAPSRSVEYGFHECLGRGSFGEVYRCVRHGSEGSDRVVAAKVLRRDIEPGSDAMVRLRDEARLLGLLDHPSIIRADELVLIDGRVGLIMEYVDGVDLGRLLKSERPPERAAVEIAATIADALHAAWTTLGPSGEPMRLVHRDIKPGNVLISRSGVVKVLDFGVARANIDREAATSTGVVMGTYQYMAPESFKAETGAPTDVYALGCTLFQMLAGRRFLNTSTLPEHYAKVSDAADYAEELSAEMAFLGEVAHPLTTNLVGRALAHDPLDRPRTHELVTLFTQLRGRLQGAPLKSWVGGANLEEVSAMTGDLTGRTLDGERV